MLTSLQPNSLASVESEDTSDYSGLQLPFPACISLQVALFAVFAGMWCLTREELNQEGTRRVAIDLTCLI